MADVAEHVTLANERSLKALSRLELAPLGDAKPSVIDDEIAYLFYRGDEPPDIAGPTGRFAVDRRLLGKFGTSAQSILDWAQTASFDLRSFGLPHPVFGMMDGIQWLLFVGAHTERHRAQLIGLLRRQGSSN